MNVDSSIKFSRAFNGYDPKEVDAAFDGMQHEIDSLKVHNQNLNHYMVQYDNRVKQLAENTRLLEEERSKESQRIAGMVSAAAQIAEQTTQTAKQDAEEIISAAQQKAVNLKEEAYHEVEKIINIERKKADSIKERAGQKAEETIKAAQNEADCIRDNAYHEGLNILEKARLDAEKLFEKAQADLTSVQTVLSKLNKSTMNLRQSNELYLSNAKDHLNEIDEILKPSLSEAPASYAAPQFTQPPPASAAVTPVITVVDSQPNQPLPKFDFELLNVI